MKLHRFKEFLQMERSIVSISKGNTFILIMIENSPKLTTGSPCRDQTAQEACDWVIENWLPHYGALENELSNQALQLMLMGELFLLKYFPYLITLQTKK